MGKGDLKINTLATGYKVTRKTGKNSGNILSASYRQSHTGNGSALGYLGKKSALGALSVAEGLGDFIGGSIHQLTGNGDYAKYLYENDVSGSLERKVDRSYSPSSGMKVAGDVASALGQAVPSFIAGVGTAGLGSAAGTASSLILGGAYAGRGIASAVSKTGKLGVKENAYGIASGALEGVTDKFLGGAVKAGKALFSAGGKEVSAGLFKGILTSAGSEAFEEFIQEYADVALLKASGVDRDAEYSFSDASYSALIGFLCGGILGGVSGIANSAANAARGEAVVKDGGEAALIASVKEAVREAGDWGDGQSPRRAAGVTPPFTQRGLGEAMESALAEYSSSAVGKARYEILGKLKRSLLAFKVSREAGGARAYFAGASRSERERWAALASSVFGYTVTESDIASNAGGIADVLSVGAYASAIWEENGSRFNARSGGRVSGEFDFIADHASFIKNSEFFKRHFEVGDPLGIFAEFFGGCVDFASLSSADVRSGFGNILNWYTSLEADSFSGYSKEEFDAMRRLSVGSGRLTFSEVRRATELIRHVVYVSETGGCVYKRGKWVSATAEAKSGFEAIEEARRISGGSAGAVSDIFRVIREKYVYTVITPEELFASLEGYVSDGVLSSSYREIRHGEALAYKVRAELLSSVAAFSAENGAFISSFERPTIDFCGTKISLSQAIGLYEVSKRQHAQGRLYSESGVYLSDRASGGVICLKVTPGDVASLYASFDEKALKYISLLEEAMRKCGRFKASADLLLKGYASVVDGHYYPISVYGGAGDGHRVSGIGSPSFTHKTVEGAEAPLFIESAAVVLERHASGISRYFGLELPLRNFGRIYGIKFEAGGSSLSLGEYFNSRIWKSEGGHALDDYLEKLFGDIERRGRSSSSVIDRAVEVLRRGYVNSVFGLNPKIILTQLASYPAAYRLLDADCLTGAWKVSPFDEANVTAMDKYSLLTYARNFDGIVASKGLIDRLSRIGKATSAGIEFTDRRVLILLYSACRLQAEKLGIASLGTKENFIAAGILLDRVIFDTQTTSLISDRSLLARDKNEMAKLFAMFKNEAAKAFSGLYCAVGRYSAYSRRAKSVPGYSAALGSARRNVARQVSAYLISSFYVGVIGVLFSKFYASGDDDGEGEGGFSFFLKQLVSSVTGLFPIISDISEYLIDGYSLDVIPLDVLNDLIYNFRRSGVLFDSSASSGDKLKFLRRFAFTLGHLLGLPVKNVIRLVEAFGRSLGIGN